MKKKMMIGFALILALVTSGCVTQMETKLENTSEPAIIDLGGVEVLNTAKVDLKELSEAVQKEIETRRSEDGAYLFTESGKTYMVVFGGECPTGGYSLAIHEVALYGAELKVGVELIVPSADMMVTDALTYPHEVIELNGIEYTDELTVSVEFENGRTDLENEERSPDGYYISSTDEIEVDKVITVGKIMQFDGPYIHIISGDLVEVFEYDNRVESEFYLGQTVQLVKGEEQNVLKPFLIEDFSIRHTNMGNMIFAEIGEITEISEETITILSEGTEKTFKTFESPDASIGDKVEVHFMNFGGAEDDSVIAVYRDASKMEVIVREIHRTNNGEMIVHVSQPDSENVDYHVSTVGALVELNYSELQIGDKLTVYADTILEGYPAQVRASRISK